MVGAVGEQLIARMKRMTNRSVRTCPLSNQKREKLSRMWGGSVFDLLRFFKNVADAREKARSTAEQSSDGI